MLSFFFCLSKIFFVGLFSFYQWCLLSVLNVVSRNRCMYFASNVGLILLSAYRLGDVVRVDVFEELLKESKLDLSYLRQLYQSSGAVPK